MNKFTRFVVGLVLLAMIVVLTSTVGFAQSSQIGRIRFVHAIPAASAIDVYTDGELTISGLSFGDASDYIKLPTGGHTVIVTPAGLTTNLWQQPISVGGGTAQTLIASTTNPLGFVSYPEELTPLTLGNARLRVIHAIANGPAVDVMSGAGERFIENLQSGQSVGDFDIPSNVYELAVIEVGGELEDTIVPMDAYSLNAGTSYLMIVYGASNNPSVMLLSTATDSAGAAGAMRIIHGVAGGPPVNILLNNTLVAPSLEFGEATEHLILPVGNYTASIQANGEEILNANLTIEENGAGTIAVIGTPQELTVAAFADNVRGVTPDKALINVINTIPGESSVTLTLQDGTVLAEELAFREAGDTISIDPSRQSPSVTFTIDGDSATVELPEQTFYGGVYYNAVALSGNSFTPPTVIFVPTSLLQSAASAPGDSEVTVASAATEAPTQAIADATTVPNIQPTTAPEVVPTQPAATAVVGPTARVVLNPDANLNLRQYPRADALSLGGAPSGTVLLLNGREGDIALPDGVTPAPEATEFVDPVSLLVDEAADLIPGETWVNITYTTPDGGTITAWVNALYLDIRNERGERMRLRDLPLIPSNQPGEASNTQLTPPPIPQDRVTVSVFNLDPGVNLNIRRTPDTVGERLTGIPNGTVAEFIGIIEEGNWAFIRYTPAEGGSITGWVSTQYIEYSYNNRKVTLEDIDERGLLQIIEPERRGEIGGGAVTAPLPTVDPIKDAFVAAPNINSDANLNLRRTPDQNAEVIARIPANARLIISGRNVAGDWLLTTFEGQSGWIASAFVTLTFNGQSVTSLDVPLAPGFAPEETATPSA